MCILACSIYTSARGVIYSYSYKQKLFTAMDRHVDESLLSKTVETEVSEVICEMVETEVMTKDTRIEISPSILVGSVSAIVFCCICGKNNTPSVSRISTHLYRSQERVDVKKKSQRIKNRSQQIKRSQQMKLMHPFK